MNDALFRENVIELLNGGSAHAKLSKALADLLPANRNKIPENSPYSVWDLFEHLRIAQNDIYKYIVDPGWKSPSWPDEYWPEKDHADIGDKKWNESVKLFNADSEGLIKIAQDPAIDLLSQIPHAPGVTYLRELMLAADHNAYHLGQIILVRKLLDNW